MNIYKLLSSPEFSKNLLYSFQNYIRIHKITYPDPRLELYSHLSHLNDDENRGKIIPLIGNYELSDNDNNPYNTYIIDKYFSSIIHQLKTYSNIVRSFIFIQKPGCDTCMSVTDDYTIIYYVPILIPYRNSGIWISNSTSDNEKNIMNDTKDVEIINPNSKYLFFNNSFRDRVILFIETNELLEIEEIDEKEEDRDLFHELNSDVELNEEISPELIHNDELNSDAYAVVLLEGKFHVSSYKYELDDSSFFNNGDNGDDEDENN